LGIYIACRYSLLLDIDLTVSSRLTTLFVAGPALHVSGRSCCPTRRW
jgi:hypothetical protein